MSDRVREIVEAVERDFKELEGYYESLASPCAFAERCCRAVLEEACEWLKTDFADTPHVARVNAEAAINGLRRHFNLGDEHE